MVGKMLEICGRSPRGGRICREDTGICEGEGKMIKTIVHNTTKAARKGGLLVFHTPLAIKRERVL